MQEAMMALQAPVMLQGTPKRAGSAPCNRTQKPKDAPPRPTLVVFAEDELTDETAPRLRELMRPVMAQRLAAVTLDITACSYLSADGAGTLFGLWRQAMESGTNLRVRATGQPRESLSTKLANFAGQLLAD